MIYICRVKTLRIMKKAILLLLIVAAFCACNKDNDTFTVDPMAKIKLIPDLNAWNTDALRSAQSDTTHLSAFEIVKQATAIQYYNKMGSDIDTTCTDRGFDEGQRDTLSSIPTLSMWATDIISSEGLYVPDFIESKNCILVHFDTTKPYGSPRDTIAYIPNAVIRAAQIAIKEAYDIKDYVTVYKIFNEAFTFRPITGAEYRALKSTNQQ